MLSFCNCGLVDWPVLFWTRQSGSHGPRLQHVRYTRCVYTNEHGHVHCPTKWFLCPANQSLPNQTVRDLSICVAPKDLSRYISGRWRPMLLYGRLCLGSDQHSVLCLFSKPKHFDSELLSSTATHLAPPSHHPWAHLDYSRGCLGITDCLLASSSSSLQRPPNNSQWGVTLSVGWQRRFLWLLFLYFSKSGAQEK